MGSRVLRVFGVISNSLKTPALLRNEQLRCPQSFTDNLLTPQVPLTTIKRDANFFVKLTADELWKGVTSVSNAGRKRGRALGMKKRKNLNKGQVLGVGKVPILFPGLNSPITQGQEIKQRHVWSSQLREEKVIPVEQDSTKYLYPKVSPIERGWTGGHIGGKKLGPPIAEDGSDDFKNFETWILESKLVQTRDGIYGRVRKIRAFVVTGNGNGLVGIASAKLLTQTAALEAAKNKAGKRLLYIPRYEEYTVLHDFVGQFGRSRVIVEKVAKGHGLVCHRAIKVCCEAIGIKDIYAKVEGSKNIRNMIKAFFIGLLQQKSYQEMADEKKLHVVEFKEEHMNYPKVLASPKEVRKSDEIKSDEIIDFKQYVLDGKVLLPRRRYVPFYTRLPSFEIHLRKQERLRGHEDTMIKLIAEHGELCSFLTEKYPEAKNTFQPRNKE